MTYDAIVACAGIWGGAISRRLAESWRKILVREKRKAIGGNCRCRTEEGVEVYRYNRTHLFHTSSAAHHFFAREHSQNWQPGDEPYYPIDNADSRELLTEYQALAAPSPTLFPSIASANISTTTWTNRLQRHS